MATTTDRRTQQAGLVPGEHAEAPTQIPPRGWWQVVRRAFKDASADNVPMLAGDVAFFAFPAVSPR